MDEDVIARRVVHAAMQIHSALGPGLLETAYRACLQRELSESGLRVDRELVMPVQYKGVVLDVAYRIDLLVESKVVLELKGVDVLLPLHRAQLLRGRTSAAYAHRRSASFAATLRRS
jgi:GxxExxY protein